MMTKPLSAPRPRGRDYILPAIVALACAGAAYAGADTTFDPALQKFTDFLEGSGGKIITVMSLAGGLIMLVGIGHHVPEEITGSIGVILIIAAFVASVRRNKRNAASEVEGQGDAQQSSALLMSKKG